MRVSGKICLVTGGAGGIGSETARTLAREGGTVIVTDVSEAESAAVAKEFGGGSKRLDVSDFGNWQAVVAEIVAEHGRIDVLAHCAGIEGNYVNAGVDTTLETWDQVIGVNLTGTFYGLKSVFPQMLKQKVGSVVLVSSIVSSMATSSGVAYGASKAGVEHLARSFAIIGLRDGARVRCNSVHPGAIRTRMTDNIFEELAQKAGVATEVIAASVKDIIPYGERGEPEDIANMILFLASDESKYASGSDFKVDGAWHVTDVG
jgi:NAD(P)-dependent dehydrogenase (short-subunit alcohol dehydrogenase family)